MGAQLVGLVLANHAGLGDRAFRVLVRMAHTALDVPNGRGRPAGLYFGGWELLAATLSLSVPPPCGKPSCRCKECETGGRCDRRRCKCSACQTRDNSQEAVRRGVKELVDAGAVKPSEVKAHRGQRQAYRLHLISPTATVPLSGEESPTATVPLSGEGSRTATAPHDPTDTGGLLRERGTATGGKGAPLQGGLGRSRNHGQASYLRNHAIPGAPT